MCGVVGFFAYRGTADAVDREELRAVRDHMAARGPDGSGEWFSADGRVGLGHRRLAVIDLSDRGAQPMASSDGQVVISFNGEIYNYRELKAQLERAGRVFRSDSDTEVLLQLYEEHGARMLSMLRGMFAFALWDGRRQALLLARDPFGIKPMYFADDGRSLRAASQVKALLHANVDTAPEPAGHAGFLLWGSVPSPWTLYRGIRALPAGHCMWVERDRSPQPQPYCVVPDVIRHAAREPARGSRADAIEAIRAALQESIAAHLVADVPVGVFLSAGLDSGMVCAAAARASSRVHAITLGFSEYASTIQDEVPLARAIGLKLGCEHDVVHVDRAGFEQQIARLIESMDQPSIDGVNTWFVALAAASRGMKVALSGLGGDELLASYPSFRDVPRLARLLAPWRGAPRLGRALRRASAPLLSAFTSPKYAGLLEYGGSFEGAYLLRRSLFMPWELPKWMDPDIAREGLDKLATLARLEGALEALPAPRHPRLAVSTLEMGWYMHNQLLRDADWAGMAHSLEIRTPFVDIQLLRATAPWFAAHPDITKFEIANAMEPVLHHDWLRRPKTGFTVPVREWLGASQPQPRGLRPWAIFLSKEATRPPLRGPQPSSPSRGLKVLMLVTDAYGGHGGIASYNRCLAEAIARSGDIGEVVVVPRVMRFDTPQVPAKVRFLRSAAGSKKRYLTAVAGLLNERFDVLICGHLNLLPLAVPFGRASGVPVVVQVHGIEAWTPHSRWTRWWLRRADAVWSVSAITRERMNRWAGLPGHKFRIIPNTFHQEHFGIRAKRTDLVERYGLAGCKVVLTLARLAGFERYKGIDEILEVLPSLARQEPDIRYVVVGDGDDQARLERKAARLGVADRVVFTGFVPESEKADHLRLADAFALPGRGEGFGIVFLEAMACGIPVVGSAVDGSREALLHGQLGELANPDDPASVQACILRALSKPKHIPEGLDTFAWARFEKRVGENLQLVLAHQPRAHGQFSMHQASR